MLVGVYIDGFNLYYGARALCGKSTPGWRWLDLRGLARRLIQTHSTWSSELTLEVTYCTARIKGSGSDRGRNATMAGILVSMGADANLLADYLDQPVLGGGKVVGSIHPLIGVGT